MTRFLMNRRTVGWVQFMGPKGFWCMPLLVFLISCAAPPKEAPFSWSVTFFSLGAKVQFSAEAPVQRLSAFNMDGVVVAQLNFPVPPRQTEALYFQWREGETYRFEADFGATGKP